MFQHSSNTMNSGEAVGNQTGIKTSLCPSKAFWKFVMYLFIQLEEWLLYQAVLVCYLSPSYVQYRPLLSLRGDGHGLK
jgi:hypothetical protein